MTGKNVGNMDQGRASSKAMALLADFGDNDDLSSGVTGGFSVISYRGSKWRVKSGGDEILITDAEGETVPSLRVVMLKANPDISKNYYENGYVEGSSEAPTCFSMDGKKPDPSVESPVSPSCAGCPKNVFGSRISENGSKGKACGDMRRTVVVPENDLANERLGGPMLLRVPAASLTELASFGKAMKAKGFPYNTIITRVSFDPDTAYPKLKFNAVRPINDEEVDQLSELLRDPMFTQKMEYILNRPIDVTPAVEEAPPAKVDDPTEFEEAAAAPKAAAPKAAAAKAAAPKAVKLAPAPVVEDEQEEGEEVATTDSLGDDIDDILAKLDDLT